MYFRERVLDNQRKPRLEDKPYLKSYRGLACLSCGKQDDSVVAAHIRTGMAGGTSLKPADDLTLPLCGVCHADQEKHPGPDWWVTNVLRPIARRQYRLWKAGKL